MTLLNLKKSLNKEEVVKINLYYVLIAQEQVKNSLNSVKEVYVSNVFRFLLKNLIKNIGVIKVLDLKIFNANSSIKYLKNPYLKNVSNMIIF